MKQEIQQLFKLFEGDIVTAAVYLYLLSILNADERQLVSLSEISKATGLSIRKIRDILSRLIKMQLIETFLRANRGYEITLVSANAPTVSANAPTVSANAPTVSANAPTVSANAPTVSANAPTLTAYSHLHISERSERISPLSKKEGQDQNLNQGLNQGLSLSSQTKFKLATQKPAKVKPPKARVLKYKPEDLELGRQWLEHSRSVHNRYEPSWTVEKFAESICKLKRVSKRTHDEVAEILDFIKEDSFWYNKALQPISLWEARGKNGNRKLVNLETKMTEKPSAAQQEQRDLELAQALMRSPEYQQAMQRQEAEERRLKEARARQEAEERARQEAEAKRLREEQRRKEEAERERRERERKEGAAKRQSFLSQLKQENN